MKKFIFPVLISIIFLLSCSSESSESKEWKETYRSNFINACTYASEGQIDYCSCIIDKMIKKHSVSELMAFDRDANAMNKEPITKYIEDCV